MSPFQTELLKKLNTNSSEPKEEDADKFFLISLIPDYKKLNDDEKIDFRIMTLQFFRNVRRKRFVQNQMPDPSSQPSYLPDYVPNPQVM